MSVPILEKFEKMIGKTALYSEMHIRAEVKVLKAVEEHGGVTVKVLMLRDVEGTSLKEGQEIELWTANDYYHLCGWSLE